MRKFAKAYHDILYNKKLSPYERLVLIHLGEAQGKNDASWNKQQTIADKLGIGRQHVNKCLGNLEKNGLITISRQRNTIFYTVAIDYAVTNNDTVAINDTTLSPLTTPIYIDKPDQLELDQFYLSDLPKRAFVKPTAQPPLASHKNPPPPKTAPDWTGKQTEQAKLAQQQADFAELWADYPKSGKVNASRKTALEKYTRALKKASHETILNGVHRYKAYLETVDKPPTAAHPATWLFQERWECEYEIVTPQAEETPAERGVRLRAEWKAKEERGETLAL